MSRMHRVAAHHALTVIATEHAQTLGLCEPIGVGAYSRIVKAGTLQMLPLTLLHCLVRKRGWYWTTDSARASQTNRKLDMLAGLASPNTALNADNRTDIPLYLAQLPYQEHANCDVQQHQPKQQLRTASRIPMAALPRHRFQTQYTLTLNRGFYANGTVQH